MLTDFLILTAAVLWIILSISVWKWHPFLSLLVASLGVGLGLGDSGASVLNHMATGFGGLLSSIGVVIVLGSILGTMLERSGATQVIAGALLKGPGRNHPVAALSFLGAFVGIPVFCDAGFIILSKLVKQLGEHTTVNKAGLSVSLATGLYATHTLVPPTPGPIAAAGNLGATSYLGMVILLGLGIAGVTLAITVMIIPFLTRNIQISMTQEPVKEDDRYGPMSLVRAVLPVVLPIILISLGTLSNLMELNLPMIGFVGTPVMALMLSLLVGYFSLGIGSIKSFTSHCEEAIRLAGPILIITGAGGAFGAVLKSSSLADDLSVVLTDVPGEGVVILLAAFTIATILKTAQGSSTSAIVITSALLATIIGDSSNHPPFFIALCVMAIGGGAMTFSHANDSYFWVVSQFSGIKVREAYRGYSVITAIQGFTVLLVVLLLYLALL